MQDIWIAAGFMAPAFEVVWIALHPHPKEESADRSRSVCREYFAQQGMSNIGPIHHQTTFLIEREVSGS